VLAPTNPNNCKAKYKDFLKPETLYYQAFREPLIPKSLMLQNFMKRGMFAVREGKPRVAAD
jgi:hypothetical protein